MELKYFEEKINRIKSEIKLSNEDILRNCYERALDQTYDVAGVVLLLNQAYDHLPKLKAASACHLAEQANEILFESQEDQGDCDTKLHNKSKNQWIIIRKMFYQMNIDTIEYAEKILPKVLCDCILQPHISHLNIDTVNEKLGVLLDMHASSPSRKFAEENLKIDNWNRVSDEKTRQVLFNIEFYIYAINLWISAAKHTIEMIESLENDVVKFK